MGIRHHFEYIIETDFGWDVNKFIEIARSNHIWINLKSEGEAKIEWEGDETILVEKVILKIHVIFGSGIDGTMFEELLSLLPKEDCACKKWIEE